MLGVLALKYGRKELELKVMKSAAGFYLGTEFNDSPFTRESGYYDSKDDAQTALEKGTWEQRHTI
ncbi:hypothetical protein [Teredinibacter purpureus]|uniref:hypothetical protein n=1 Tax=Teredinibacter purpureus TaxID=2731756 RepID=UPI0005F86E75|nr:hypothetical protein [Teredinibacter purpureus]